MRLQTPGDGLFFNNLAMSPDGTLLSYSMVGDSTKSELFLAPAAGGEPRLLYRSPDDRHVASSGIVWAPDGDSLLVGLRVAAARVTQLWQFFPDDRPPRPLGLSARGIATPRIHPNGRDILFASRSGSERLKVMALDNLVSHLAQLE